MTLVDVPVPRLFELSGSVLGGRYAVEDELGRGGMATVYAGRRLGLLNRVAIKVLHPELGREPANVKRFLREARAASLIAHENVVDILDFGEVDRLPVYFVMEFLEGSDLRKLLERRGPLPWDEARAIAVQVTGALAAAHGHGIVHRDVKPGNIFVVDRSGVPHVKVLDFGIAKIVADNDKLTRGVTLTQGILGTVAYMAPEQARSQTLDARTDVYQLGVVLYQMLTGTVPFRGSSPFSVLARHIDEPPVPLREVRPGVPEELEAIVLTCLAKQPEDRFQSMAAIREALLAIDPDASAPVPVFARKPTVIGVQATVPPTAGELATGDDAGVPAGGTLVPTAHRVAATEPGLPPVVARAVPRSRSRTRRRSYGIAFAIGSGIAVIGVAGVAILQRSRSVDPEAAPVVDAALEDTHDEDGNRGSVDPRTEGQEAAPAAATDRVSAANLGPDASHAIEGEAADQESASATPDPEASRRTPRASSRRTDRSPRHSSVVPPPVDPADEDPPASTTADPPPMTHRDRDGTLHPDLKDPYGRPR